MSNDNGGYPPPGQQPPAYPGIPLPPQQPAYPGAASQPGAPIYPGSGPSGAPTYPGATPPAAPGYPGATPPVQAYPGAVPTAPGYPTAYAQPYGQPYPTPQRTNGLAITSLICGIVAVVFCWAYLILPLLAGVPAVITGHMALKKTKSDPTLGGRGLAITGLITGYIGIALGLLIGALIIVAIVATFSYSRYGS